MMRRLLVAVLDAGLWLRPLLGGPACRFSPSCSAYAREALSARPAPRALWLIVWRLARCQPFHPGGWDPLPAS